MGNPSTFFCRECYEVYLAQVCAQRVWRGILALSSQFGLEIWTYVHSAIPNALLDNTPDRLLVCLYDGMSLLIPSDAHYEKSCKLATEMIIQNTVEPLLTHTSGNP